MARHPNPSPEYQHLCMEGTPHHLSAWWCSLPFGHDGPHEAWSCHEVGSHLLASWGGPHIVHAL